MKKEETKERRGERDYLEEMKKVKFREKYVDSACMMELFRKVFTN